MFRYKGNRGSAGLAEEHSKITHISSGDSTSSKDEMDPAKDSWVFSKDGTRKYSNNRRRETHDDDLSYSIREETNTPPVDAKENVKVNVLYRGMVYRIRGIKIICSVLAGIILLLAAIVILGVWIILGASGDGKFYFPWSDSSTGVNDTSETDMYNSSITENYSFPTEIDIRLPPTGIYEEEISYKIPSEEVGEALGHLQAVHPKPKYPTDNSETGDGSTLEDYDEYYEDYEEEYYDDAIDEYSLLHSTMVEPPPGFIPDVQDNFEINPRNLGENNFRVYINGDEEMPTITNEEKENYEEIFRPSARIPEYLSSEERKRANDPRQIRLGSRRFESNIPRNQHLGSRENGADYPERIFTNSHIAQHTKQSKPPSGDSVVEYDGVLIKSKAVNSPTFYDEENYDYQVTQTSQEKFLDTKPVSSDYTNTNEGKRNFQIPREPEHADEIIVEEDPHRKLFIGKYSSDEIIFDDDLTIPSKSNRRISDRSSFGGSENIRQQSRFPVVYQKRPQAKRPINPDPQYPVKRRQVPGTVHPIPTIRRSHISAGFRPRLSKTNVEFLRNQDRQNTNLADRAEKYADELITNAPRSPVLRDDSPMNRRPIAELTEKYADDVMHSVPRSPVPRVDGPINRRPISERTQQYGHQLSHSIHRSTLPRMDGPINRRPGQVPRNAIRSPHSSRLPPGLIPGQQKRHPPFALQHPGALQQNADSGFINSLQDMYEYSKRIASSLMQYPQKNDIAATGTSSDFLKNSFGFLADYNHVFSNLPQVFMEPLIRFQLPSSEQLDNLNPFQLSLITWTFIDFWEFLIEKVGTLSREDLRTLELRLAKIRQTKDSSIARALIDSIPTSDDGAFNEEIETAVKTLELSLPVESSRSVDGGIDGDSGNSSKSSNNWENISTLQEQSDFMQYSIRTLFNFGKVYLRSDYALDCMMLLFCKDINSNTKHGGMEGVAARLKR